MREKIVEIDELGDSELILLYDTQSDEEKEAIILKDENDEYQVWLNYCQHITTVKLDKGNGVTEREDEIVCQNHGAMFKKSTGKCTYGPCKGAVLPKVNVECEDSVLYLEDERYRLESISVENDEEINSTSGESDFA